MKKLFAFNTLFTLLLFANMSFAQGVFYAKESTDSSANSESYDNSEVEKYVSNFATEFKSDDDKQDFKKLRGYLKKKKSKLSQYNTELNSTYLGSGTKPIENDIMRAEKIVRQYKKDTDTVNQHYYFAGGGAFYYEYEGFPKGLTEEDEDYDYYSPIQVSDLKSEIEEMKEMLETMNNDIRKSKLLKNNIKIIQEDIEACEDQIDEALAPEYEKQDFRQGVSLNFTVLIGVLLFGFFFIIYKKSDNTIGKEFLGDNGLQFVTLFVLVIAIILFGILGILEGRELAAILAGISGYILGKGIDKTTPAPAPTPTPIMAPIVEGSPAPTDSDSANSNT